MQNRELQIEDHDHRNGVCDLEFRIKPWRDRSACNYRINYYSTVGRKLYGRPSKMEQCYRAEANGSARTQLRNAMSELCKMVPEDVEDWDVVNPRHRHYALWDLD